MFPLALDRAAARRGGRVAAEGTAARIHRYTTVVTASTT